LLALVIPALLPPPMPFKIFVVTAGALNYPAAQFAIVIMIARTARYYFWGVLAFFFRSEVLQVLKWLESHIVEVLAGVIAALALFFIARWLVLRLRTQPPDQKTQASFTD
jgi:membrane protein DedA with SNARE-associated domain